MNKSQRLSPVYRKNQTVIALSANNYYVPYVAVLLQSIKIHMDKHKNYDILILHCDITSESQRDIKQIFRWMRNASVRFCDVTSYGLQNRKLFLCGHFKLETYYRFLLPEILYNYEKVLYLDADMIVKSDVSYLFETDIDGYLLAACHDADTAGLYNGYFPNKKEYMDNILKIAKPYEYFQAGVILFNLKEFRKTFTTEQIISFAESYHWELLDQDVLNFIAQGRYKPIDMSWNVMVDWKRIRISEIISLAPQNLRDEYFAARANPRIIHYAGPEKPWDFPRSDFANQFWEYAQQTHFYNLLLERLGVRKEKTR